MTKPWDEHPISTGGKCPNCNRRAKEVILFGGINECKIATEYYMPVQCRGCGCIFLASLLDYRSGKVTLHDSIGEPEDA